MLYLFGICMPETDGGEMSLWTKHRMYLKYVWLNVDREQHLEFHSPGFSSNSVSVRSMTHYYYTMIGYTECVHWPVSLLTMILCTSHYIIHSETMYTIHSILCNAITVVKSMLYVYKRCIYLLIARKMIPQSNHSSSSANDCEREPPLFTQIVDLFFAFMCSSLVNRNSHFIIKTHLQFWCISTLLRDFICM